MKRQLLLYILVFLSHFCAITQCEWKTTLEQDLYDSYDLTQHLDANPNDINAHRVLYELGEASRKDIDEIKFVSKYLPLSKEYQRLVSEIKTAGGYLKWKNIADAENDLIDILKPLKVKYNDEVLNALTKDFPNTSDLKRVVDGDLVDSWKVLSDVGETKLVNDIDDIEYIDYYIKTSGKTYAEVKAAIDDAGGYIMWKAKNVSDDITQVESGLKINIYGEGEALPRFHDVATNPEFANGRILTSQLKEGSVSDVFIRSSPLDDVNELNRLIGDKGVITLMSADGKTLSSQIESIKSTFGSSADVVFARYDVAKSYYIQVEGYGKFLIEENMNIARIKIKR